MFLSLLICFHLLSLHFLFGFFLFFFFFLFPPWWWTPSNWWLKTLEVLFTKAINVPVLISCFTGNKPDTKPSLVDTKILARPHWVSQFADSRGLRTKGVCSRPGLARKAPFCSSLKRILENHWIIQLEGTVHIFGIQRLLISHLLTLTGLEDGVQEDGEHLASYVWVCTHACVSPFGERFSDPKNPKNHWECNPSPLLHMQTSRNQLKWSFLLLSVMHLLSGLSFVTYVGVLHGLLLYNYLCFRVLVSFPLK